MDEINFCPKCGASRGEGHAFCPKCGREFGKPVEAVIASPSKLPPPPKPVFRALVDIVVGAIVVTIAIAVLLLVVVVASYLLQSNSNGPGALIGHATSVAYTPLPTPVPTVPCDQAESAVEARHSTLFGLMSTGTTGFRISCGAPGAGVRSVLVYWDWNGSSHIATYEVTLNGRVSAADANAQRIDVAAKYGPLAFKVLMGSGL